MIITTPAIDEQQNIITFFADKSLSPIESEMLQEALGKRSELISNLAILQNIDRRVIVRARLGIK